MESVFFFFFAFAFFCVCVKVVFERFKFLRVCERSEFKGVVCNFEGRSFNQKGKIFFMLSTLQQTK